MSNDIPHVATESITKGEPMAGDSEPVAKPESETTPAPVWPPAVVEVRQFETPLTAWTRALRHHFVSAMLFPPNLVIQEVVHEDRQVPFVLVGVAMFTRRGIPFVPGPRPVVGDGQTWGGVVEINGQALRLGSRYAAEMVSQNSASHGIVKCVLAGRIPATEGTVVVRYLAGTDGTRVEGSEETWLIAGGQVRQGSHPKLDEGTNDEDDAKDEQDDEQDEGEPGPTLVDRLREVSFLPMLDKLRSGEVTPSDLTALVIAGMVVADHLRQSPQDSAFRCELERDLIAKGEWAAGYLHHETW